MRNVGSTTTVLIRSARSTGSPSALPWMPIMPLPLSELSPGTNDAVSRLAGSRTASSGPIGLLGSRRLHFERGGSDVCRGRLARLGAVNGVQAGRDCQFWASRCISSQAATRRRTSPDWYSEWLRPPGWAP